MEATRRRLLGVAGAAIPTGVAGCLSDGTPEETTNGKTSSEGESTEASGNEESATGNRRHGFGAEVVVDGVGTVVVESVTVQRSVIHHHTHREIYEPARAQLLVVGGRLESDAHPSDVEFRARLDGELVESDTRTWLYPDGRLRALSVPVDTVTDAAIVLRADDRPEWELPASAREAMGALAAFHLHDATIREAAGGTGLELTVENQGERDGVFRGVLEHASAADADAAIRFPVPAGETVTETIRHSHLDSWASDATFSHEITPTVRVFAVD